MPRSTPKRSLTAGIGQLSLVEHALCPLDARRSLQENYVHTASHSYTDQNRKRRRANIRVLSALGLSPRDEVYLWGLLALTFCQPEVRAELRATPHWCLRQLGVIDQQRRRGGRQYRDFEEAIQRLSAVTYLNDAFFDPIRREHRRVSFGFLSYSLPEDRQSSRSWRFLWDPLFFEIVSADASQLRFDFDLYTSLDLASRRMFLFLRKVFIRRPTLRSLVIRDLAVNVLGFSDSLSTRDLKVRIHRSISRLQAVGIIQEAQFMRTGNNEQRLRLSRGEYFLDKLGDASKVSRTPDSDPLLATLIQLGFDEPSAQRLLARHKRPLVQEWLDITMAASEQFGDRFFKRSPMAFLVDSLKHASRGTRTPPDWWLSIRRDDVNSPGMTPEARDLLTRLRSEVFGDAQEQPRASSSQGMQRVSDLLRSA